MMKLGILGAGMIVREFLPWLTGPESPFKVEALCSTERSAGAAQALCDQYGVPRHTTSYDELLSWVDVVYIAVPNILHVKYTRAALEAGRHVIVEKPMAPRRRWPKSWPSWPGAKSSSSSRLSPRSIRTTTPRSVRCCPR